MSLTARTDLTQTLLPSPLIPAIPVARALPKLPTAPPAVSYPVSRMQNLLPLFFEGVADPHRNFQVIGFEGAMDMLTVEGSPKAKTAQLPRSSKAPTSAQDAEVAPVVTSLAHPLKAALSSDDPSRIFKGCRLLVALASVGPMTANALVPHYREILSGVAGLVASKAGTMVKETAKQTGEVKGSEVKAKTGKVKEKAVVVLVVENHSSNPEHYFRQLMGETLTLLAESCPAAREAIKAACPGWVEKPEQGMMSKRV